LHSTPAAFVLGRPRFVVVAWERVALAAVIDAFFFATGSEIALPAAALDQAVSVIPTAFAYRIHLDDRLGSVVRPDPPVAPPKIDHLFRLS